jgi:phosphoglycolate phosphatase
MIEFLMFDADGVLFDSYQSNIAYYNAILTQVGEPPLNHEEELASISYAAGEVFRLRADEGSAKLAKMFEIARTLNQEPFFRLLRPSFDLRPFMLELKKRYRLGLATNRSATVPGLVKYLDLEGIFDAIASVLDKVPPKPAPDILELCIKRAGVSRDSAVYIGDSKIDCEAAEAAGIAFIGVGERVDHLHRIAHLGELSTALAEVGTALGKAAEAALATKSSR